MDFWTRQEKAENNSKILFIIFIIVIFACISSPFIILETCIALMKHHAPKPGSYEKDILEFLIHYKVKILIIFSTLSTLPVVIGALIQYLRLLNDSGQYIASVLYASQLEPNSKNFFKRRLINVVSEISIAAGVPMPRVYILTKEAGINALTAGTNSHNAVLCVTRGACELLKRDELQAIIAHEYSHLINGDMKFNTFSLGLLHGFYLSLKTVSKLDITEGISGYVFKDLFMLTIQIISILLLVPFWLWCYGTIFSTLGNIIKAAFNRKREYLADACAVQYTRHPEALATTLNIIQNAPAWQNISTTSSFELSHFFFSNPNSSSNPQLISFLTASHPNPIDRIKQILPNFKPSMELTDRKKIRKKIYNLRDGITEEENASRPLQSAEILFFQHLEKSTKSNEEILSPAAFQSSAKILKKIPSSLKEMTETSNCAIALIYAILTDKSSEKTRTIQFELILESTSPETASFHSSAFSKIQNSSLSALMILTELSIPALRSLAPKEYDEFKTMCLNLIMTDNAISFFEYAIFSMITIVIDSTVNGSENKIILNDKFTEDKKIEYLLSFASYCGADNKEQALQAFKKGLEASEEKQNLTIQTFNPIQVEKLNLSIRHTSKMKLDRKKRIIKACLTAVYNDKKITETEWCILRMLCIALQTPFPLP